MGTHISLVSSVVRTAKLSRKIGMRSAVLVESALREQHPPENAKLIEVTLPGYASPIYLRSCTADVNTFYQIIVNAEYDIRPFQQFQRIDALYRKATADGRRPLIIDCGANIGLSTIWFARLFPEAQIFAVEPAADNIEVAKQNLRAYPNVTLLQGAVWDRQVRVKISDTTVRPDAYQVVEAQGGADENPDNTLRAFTISEIIDMADTHQALIVKIDIEGGEAILFRSNTEWIGVTDLIAIELHDWMLPKQLTSAPFIRSFANLDFELLQKGETLFLFLNKPVK